MNTLAPEPAVPVNDLPCVIPQADYSEFAGLPESVRFDVLLKLKVMKAIEGAPNLVSACIQEAVRLQRRGFSWPRLRSLYYKYRASRDWRTLVNGSRAPEFAGRRVGLPAEFRVYVHDFLMLNQRGRARPRYRRLLDQLRAWRAHPHRKEFAIPGYDTPPEDDPGCDHPAGWSYARLVRLKPSRLEQAAMSIGRGAASAYRPQVYSTRAGLRVGQILFFDDQVHDVRVNHAGNRRKVQRPLELCCMDCFSAAFVAHGFKPALWQDDAETRVMLRKDDMEWFAVNWLMNIGWREDTGTLVVAEHGTAAFTDWMQEKIGSLTGGKITFSAGGVDRRATFPGMFDAAARGNFRIKAGLESAFNLLRNETADMVQFPGQVGRDRDHAPEEWEARARHNELLLLAAETLTAEQQEQLRYPFLEWNQFCRLALDVYDRINRRTEHELEGWERSGLVANEWRPTPDSPWLPMSSLLALPSAQQGAVRSLLDAEPESLTRTRKLSPHEVWHRHRTELTRAPGYWIALILPPDYGRERRVQDNHLFEIEDQDISPDPMRFAAQNLKPGESYLTYLNPWDTSALYVCDARQRYLCAAPAWRTVPKADLDALHKQCGRAAAIERDLLVPVSRAGANLARTRALDARHNAAVLANTPVDRERERELDVRARSADIDSILGDGSDPPTKPESEPGAEPDRFLDCMAEPPQRTKSVEGDATDDDALFDSIL